MTQLPDETIKKLDEILNVLYMQGEDIGKLEYGSATHQITAVSGAKQAIIDWHNKQIEEALDRLESKAFYDPSGTSPLINPREIQAERAKIKEVK